MSCQQHRRRRPHTWMGSVQDSQVWSNIGSHSLNRGNNHSGLVDEVRLVLEASNLAGIDRSKNAHV